MAEGNGNRDTRLDRIEKALELLLDDHEQFRVDHKQLLSAQVLLNDSLDKLLQTTQEHTKQIEAQGRQLAAEADARREKDAPLDGRVDMLVSAIGELIRTWNARPATS